MKNKNNELFICFETFLMEPKTSDIPDKFFRNFHSRTSIILIHFDAW